MRSINLGSQARGARIEAGHTIIRTAHIMGYSTEAVKNMERGVEGTEAFAKKVIGHYRGIANRKPPKDPIGVMVRDMRIAAGHTQEQLAKKIGVDATYMSRIESNPLRWSRPMARKVFELYGADASVIPGRAPRGQRSAA